MNQHSYKVLEFYKLKELLTKYAITEEAAHRLIKLEKFNNINKLKLERNKPINQ